MNGWLRDWGQGSSTEHDDHDMADMEGMEMEDMEMEGMLSDQQMKELEGASGAQFDRLFLQGMISHHEGAVTMAEEELKSGRFPAAKELAQRIIDSQRAEIAEMNALLAA
jgi:uncharacterized protein (DUF305 family)